MNKVFEFTDNPHSSRAAACYGFVMEIGSFVSCLILVARTFDGAVHGGTNPQFPSLDRKFFFDTDVMFTSIFTLDFLLRLASCPSFWKHQDNNPSTQRTHFQPFARSPFNWFDLASILPFYFEELFGVSKFVALLRLCRMLRILKMTRNFSGTYILVRAINESRAPLKLAIIFLSINGLLFGSLMYLIDPCYDKTVCSFKDAFNGVYFAFVTMSTVGYGDLVPLKDNSLARCLTMVLMILGALFLAMPIAIIGSEFDRAWASHTETDQKNQNIEAQSNLRRTYLKYAGADETKPITVLKVGSFSCPNRTILESKVFTSTTTEIISRYDAAMEPYLSMMRPIGTASTRAQKLLHRMETPREDWVLDELRHDINVICANLNEFEYYRTKVEIVLSTLVVEDKQSNVFFQIFCAQRMAKQWRQKAKKTLLYKVRHTHDTRTHQEEESYSKIVRHIKKYNLKYTLEDVVTAQQSKSWRDKLWLLLDVPFSSRTASIVGKVLLWSLIGSIAVTVGETMPDFQKHGQGSYFCEKVVEEYCTSIYSNPNASTTDPACFVHPSMNLGLTPTPLRFDCFLQFGSNDVPNPACYSVGLNFGSENPNAYTCFGSTHNSEWIQPFRNATQLKGTGHHDICLRLQCDGDGATYIDMAEYWVYYEWYFAIIFTLEQIGNFIVQHTALDFFKDPVVWINIVSIVPFYMAEFMRIKTSSPAIYAIPPGSSDIRTVVQMLRITRIYKFYRSMPDTHILYGAIVKASKKLAAPYFLLGITMALFSFILYEFESGVECFIGTDCIVNGIVVPYPDSAAHMIPNKRVFINDKGELSEFEDVFSSLWFSFAAITSIGYGDMVPITQPGRFCTVLAILIGACYTAMPLTVMGGEFRTLFSMQKRRIALIGSRHKATYSLNLSGPQSLVWHRFLKLEWGDSWHFNNKTVLKEKIAQLFFNTDFTEEELETQKQLIFNEISRIVANIKAHQQVSFQMGSVVHALRRHGAELAFEQREKIAEI